MNLKNLTTLAFMAIGLLFANVAKANETIVFTEEAYGGLVFDGVFNKVSNNGKWAVGNGVSFCAYAYYYDLEKKELVNISNPKAIEMYEDGDSKKAINYFTTAYDCSDNGIIVGTYVHPDETGKYPARMSVPSYYVISEKKWYKLQDKTGCTVVESGIGNNTYGEATCISKDGKYIGGWILNKVKNYAGGKETQLGVPCLWVLNEDTKEYEMVLPLTTEKIATQGDRVFHMSDNGERLAGVSCYVSGIWGAAIWDKEYNRKQLMPDELEYNGTWDPETQIPDWVDDQDMNIGATTTGVSTNGRFVTCAATHDTYGATKGYRYDCETEELEELTGIPGCITDLGTPVIMNLGMGGYSSIDDSNTILAGSTVASVGDGGSVNVPVITILSQPYKEGDIIDTPNNDLNYVENLGISVYNDGNQVTVEGEYTSFHICTVTGVIVGRFDNTTSTVDLSNLAAGVYYVTVVKGEKYTTQPIIVK